MVFEFKKGSDELVGKYFENLFENSEKIPTTGQYKGNENAKIVDKYNLFNNNCVTQSIKGLQSGVENLKLNGIKTPTTLKYVLELWAKITNDDSVTKLNYEEIKNELEQINEDTNNF